jgi:hypothetical protein
MGSLIPYPTALELVAAVASLACFEELAWLGGIDITILQKLQSRSLRSKFLYVLPLETPLKYG